MQLHVTTLLCSRLHAHMKTSKLLAPSTNENKKNKKKGENNLGPRFHHTSNKDGILLVTAAATATPARHMSGSKAREKRASGYYCSQAGHLHSTVCSDRDRRGPCTLHSSGASPEGSSAPEARSHPSPAPRGLEELPCGWCGPPNPWEMGPAKMHEGT